MQVLEGATALALAMLLCWLGSILAAWWGLPGALIPISTGASGYARCLGWQTMLCCLQCDKRQACSVQRLQPCGVDSAVTACSQSKLAADPLKQSSAVQH